MANLGQRFECVKPQGVAMKNRNVLLLGMLAMVLAFMAPVAVSAQDFTDGIILAQAQSTIIVRVTGWNQYTNEERTSSYSFTVSSGGLAGERDRNEAQLRARRLFLAENPGFVVIKTSWY